MGQTRRTHAERREETRKKLIVVARRMFGENGYSASSLEDIAKACGVTIRPIYHYFQNKLGLFEAVIQSIEDEGVQTIETMEDASASDIWSGFMKNCEDPHYRQIMLIDAPTLLGRQRMNSGRVVNAARDKSANVLGRRPDGLSMSLLFGALSNAAFYIAENGVELEDYARIRDLIDFFSSETSDS